MEGGLKGNQSFFKNSANDYLLSSQIVFDNWAVSSFQELGSLTKEDEGNKDDI